MSLIKKKIQTARRAVWYDVYYDYTNKKCVVTDTTHPAGLGLRDDPEKFGWFKSRDAALDNLQSIIDNDLADAQKEHAQISKVIARARRARA